MTARVHLWADDLTGAAELAGLLHARSGRAAVMLQRPSGGESDAVHDLDLRHSSYEDAYDTVRAMLSRLPRQDRVALKVDSQMHGPVDAYVDAFRDSHRVVTVCPVNPDLGRVTARGRHRVPTAHGDATTDLLSLLSPAVGSHQEPEAAVMIADAGSHDDLARAASQATGRDAVGSAAFIDAWLDAGQLERTGPAQAPADSAYPRSLLIVAGSTEPMLDQQMAELTAEEPVTLIASDADIPYATRLDAQHALANGGIVLIRTAPARIADAAKLAARLTEAAAADRLALFLTGGHTARRVLDALRVTRLTSSTGSAPHVSGIASFVDDRGRQIHTKPGSYGEPDALRAIARALVHPPITEHR